MVSSVPTGGHHGAPKHGDALLAGLIRCNRCGHMMESGPVSGIIAERAQW
jgi:hypothetical protein